MDGTMNLLPLTTGAGSTAGAAAAGAVGGGLLGGLLFNGGYGGWGGYGRGGYAAVDGAGNGFTTQYILDQISNLSGQMDSQTTLMNANDNNLDNSICTNNTSMLQMGAQLERAIMNSTATTQLESCRETNALTNTIADLGSDIALANANQAAAMAACCCQTQRAIDSVNFQSVQNTCNITNAIRDDGAATRALINDLATQELRDKLCDAKAQIAALNAEQFMTGKMADQTNLIIQHVAAICGKNCNSSSFSNK